MTAQHGAAAANASSVTFTAAVAGWTKIRVPVAGGSGK